MTVAEAPALIGGAIWLVERSASFQGSRAGMARGGHSACPGDLLTEVGCTRLTMDEIARRVGIAKGSLYLHTPTRRGLAADLSDQWAPEVPSPTEGEAPDDASPVRRVCQALFQRVPRGELYTRPAIPCCLRTSPCPHGWDERWDRIARSHGLGGGELPRILGQAVQALASTETVRLLVQDDKLEEAGALVWRFIDSLASSATA